MRNVLYTGAFQMPDRDAAATRVVGMAELFVNSNFDVTFAGWEVLSGDVKTYDYSGYKCFPQAEYKPVVGFTSKVSRFLFMGLKTFRWIRQNPYYDIYVLYNPPAIFAALMLSWCKIKKKRLVLDSTEWYESGHIINWSGGKCSVKGYLAVFENIVRMRLVYPRFKNIIAISFFLESYYKRRNVIRVPPILDNAVAFNSFNDIIYKRKIGEELCFIYAGTAGKKDNIIDFILALPEISAITSRKVRLLIVGMTSTEVGLLLSEAGCSPEAYYSYYRVLGRVSRAKALVEYKTAHFSVLLRDNMRYAKAGFPTKLMESWRYGCPVIANAVGDISTLADPGIDTIFVNRKNMAKHIGSKLKEVIDNNGYAIMSERCAQKAAVLFSKTTYYDSFDKFVSRVMNRSMT
jgi:glycosyltransferase involved in cell wall biosynthesis